MPTLTIASGKDYRIAPDSALVNGQNITNITFTNTVASNALFLSTQFGNGSISNNVLITGALAQSNIIVNMPGAGSFSAAAWSFSNWLSSNGVTFVGSADDDSITGSSVSDLFRNSSGVDTLRGGDGDDRFLFTLASETAVNEIVDGGAGNDSVLINGSNQIINFTGLQLSGIERLSVLASGSQAILNAAQANGLTQIEAGTGNQSVTISVDSVVDLSDIAFTDWTNGTDTININGTGLFGMTLTGSTQNDTISVTGNSVPVIHRLRGGSGADTLTGANFAAQTVHYAYGAASDIVAGEVVTGQAASTDRLVIDGSGVFDFRSVALTSIEAVDFDAFNGTSTAIFNSSQFGTGLSTSLQFDGSDRSSPNIIEIRVDTLGFSAANFTTVNFSVNRDILSIIGTSGSDTITAANFGSKITGGAGVDFLRGSNADDTFVYNAASETGDGSVQGSGGLDTIEIRADAAFSFATTGLSGIEQYIFNTAGLASITLDASQISSPTLLVLSSSTTAKTFTVNNISGAFSASGWTFNSAFSAASITVLNAGNANASDTITGTTGRDSISGGLGNDLFIGGGGNDTFNGGSGVDTISFVADTQAVAINLLGSIAVRNTGLPGATFNTLFLVEHAVGGAGNDFITGDDAANRFEGSGGADNLWGFVGNDTLTGGDGDDIIVGGDNDDVLDSGIGQDWLYGEGGADTLRATDATSNSFNVLVGGDGDDTLIGGPTGFDYFYGGDGATGGGNDTFVIAANSGIKVMNDFEAGGANDAVRPFGTSLSNFAQVQASLTFSPTINGTVLVVDAGTQVWFVGLQINQLTASDFVFV